MNAMLKPADHLANGLHFDQSEADYHADRLGVLSCSAIKQMTRSPKHYHAWATGAVDDNETPARRLGKAFHVALLEPEKFASLYTVLPSDAPRDLRYLRDAKKASDDTRAAIAFWDGVEASGKRLLPADEFDRIAAMVRSVQDHPWAKLLVQGGHSEVTLRWTDEATGLPCKARADYYREAPKRYVLDVKTCADASPQAFARAVVNFGYDIQHAHYADGFRTLGLPLDGFYLLAIESEAPYVCQPYYLDAEAEGRGFHLRQAGATAMKRCLAADRWPGYSDDITCLALPGWATRTPQETNE